MSQNNNNNNNNSSSHHHQTIAHHHMQDISGLPLLNTTSSLQAEESSIEELRFDDDDDASLIDLQLSDVKDDVFMGYNDDQDYKAANAMHFKVEIDDEMEIDQVVPTRRGHEDVRCEDSTLDVLYVN